MKLNFLGRQRLINPFGAVAFSLFSVLGFNHDSIAIEITSQDVPSVKEFASDKLEDLVTSLSISDLAELDENEAYIDEDPHAELDVVRDMLRNLGQIMIQNYLSDDAKALAKSQQFPNASLRMLRDAHPQGLICLEGKANIKANDVFASGMFSKPASYDVVTRFSSSSPSLKDDANRDIRGLAIKLKAEPFEHDLITISSPIFPTDNAKQFNDLVKLVRLSDCLSNPENLFTCIYDTGLPNPWRLLQSALRLIRLTASSEDNGLLEKKFFSVSSYKFEANDQKIYFKFHLEPKRCDGKEGAEAYALVKAGEANYLADNVRTIISQKDVCFDIRLTQMPSDETASFLETHSKTWEEISERTKVISLGELRFAKGSSELDSLACDNLSFSPAHTADGFSPLGSINRARSILYSRLSNLRHATNEFIGTL